MCKRLLIVVVWIIALVCAPVGAQTTQPAGSGWDDTTASLAQALIDEHSESQLNALLPQTTSIQKLGTNEVASASDLHDKTRGQVTISARAFTWPADTLASDLAADITSGELMPEKLRKQFVPPDDEASRRFNITARQWAGNILHPEVGEFVSLIVLWQPSPTATTSNPLLGSMTSAELQQPVFILVKGKRDEQGIIKIVQLSYGDASQALK